MAEQALFIDVLKRDIDVTPDIIEQVASDVAAIVEEAGIGEYDGEELAVDGSHARLYFYGPDAEAILTAVMAVLRKHLSNFSVGAHLRYGDVNDPNASEKRTRLFGWQ